MRNILLLIIAISLAFVINFADGQDRGINCYSTKAFGPYSDSNLPALGNGYYCCKDNVAGELSFYVKPQVSGWCGIEGTVWGSNVTVYAYSEDFDEGYHMVSESGYSGEWTRDSLGIDIAIGSTTGHFSNIYLTARYSE